jgi:two-component system, LytTR family, response regulator
MPNIRAIIVEDEPAGRDNLSLKIRNNCPDVEIVAMSATGEDAINDITRERPQLVFMDIQLGSMSGFDVLERVQYLNFEVVFTTAYEQYAIKAFKLNALDYLIKPIDVSELIEAVNKVRSKIERFSVPPTRLAIPMGGGVKIISFEEIVYCESDDNNAYIFLEHNSKEGIKVPRTLTSIIQKLPAQDFFQIQRSYVVNRRFVTGITSEGFATVKTGKSLSISKDKKDNFRRWLENDIIPL